MAYLTESEIPMYTTIPNIDMQLIETASTLIDAYKGCSFMSKEHVESTKLSKKRGQYGDEYRGKLKHLPRTSVSLVKSYVPSAFGDEQEMVYPEKCLRFDGDESLYFRFIPTLNNNSPFATPTPQNIIVTYSSGYTESTIPDALKRVTGLLADNLKKNGGTFSWKTRDDFDCKITLADSSIFPMELKQMVNMVVLT